VRTLPADRCEESVAVMTKTRRNPAMDDARVGAIGRRPTALGWGIGTRLIWAAGFAACLWIAVGWALS
jgi:hypothetical protein